MKRNCLILIRRQKVGLYILKMYRKQCSVFCGLIPHAYLVFLCKVQKSSEQKWLKFFLSLNVPNFQLFYQKSKKCRIVDYQNCKKNQGTHGKSTHVRKLKITDIEKRTKLLQYTKINIWSLSSVPDTDILNVIYKKPL